MELRKCVRAWRTCGPLARGRDSLEKENAAMTESSHSNEKPLEELERKITCAICHVIYQQAKLLSCNHYYCSTCIDNMANESL